MSHDPKKAAELAALIDALIEYKLGYRASFVLTYSEAEPQQFHWITNVKREDGLTVMRETLKQMQAEGN